MLRLGVVLWVKCNMYYYKSLADSASYCLYNAKGLLFFLLFVANMTYMRAICSNDTVEIPKEQTMSLSLNFCIQ